MNCRCCDRFLKSSSITVGATSVVITVESNATLNNLDRFCLLLTQNLPVGSNTLPVEITISSTTYPMYTRSGNLLRADQLRCRKLYPVIFGTDPNHFSLVNCVPNTTYSAAPATPTT